MEHLFIRKIFFQKSNRNPQQFRKELFSSSFSHSLCLSFFFFFPPFPSRLYSLHLYPISLICTIEEALSLKALHYLPKSGTINLPTVRFYKSLNYFFRSICHSKVVKKTFKSTYLRRGKFGEIYLLEKSYFVKVFLPLLWCT